MDLLLDHHAGGRPRKREVWRAAQRHWEDTLEAFLHGRGTGLSEAEYRTINRLVRLIFIEDELPAPGGPGT